MGGADRDGEVRVSRVIIVSAEPVVVEPMAHLRAP